MPLIPELEDGLTEIEEVEDGQKRVKNRPPLELHQLQQLQLPDDDGQQFFVSVAPTTPTL